MSNSNDDIAIGFAKNASMLGYAQDFIGISQAIEAGADAIAYMIPVIGTILRLILFFILRPKQPKGPFFGLALVLPKDTYPTIGAAFIASQNFRSLALHNGQDIPPEGAIVITEGGMELAHTEVQKTFQKIQDLQQQMMLPFYLSVSNLSPVFARAVVNAVISPPLTFKSEYGDYYFLGSIPEGFKPYVLSRSASLNDAVSTGYHYFAQVINDAFLRVAYVSVLDSPIREPMPGSVNDLTQTLNVLPTPTTAPPSQTALPVPAAQQVQTLLPQQVEQSNISFGALPLALLGVFLLAARS